MSNPDGTPTYIEELALVLYGQLETGHWTKDSLDLIEDALQAAYDAGRSGPLAPPEET
jgi:hypothetical protein